MQSDNKVATDASARGANTASCKQRQSARLHGATKCIQSTQQSDCVEHVYRRKVVLHAKKQVIDVTVVVQGWWRAISEIAYVRSVSMLKEI